MPPYLDNVKFIREAGRLRITFDAVNPDSEAVETNVFLYQDPADGHGVGDPLGNPQHSSGRLVLPPDSRERFPLGYPTTFPLLSRPSGVAVLTGPAPSYTPIYSTVRENEQGGLMKWLLIAGGIGLGAVLLKRAGKGR